MEKKRIFFLIKEISEALSLSGLPHNALNTALDTMTEIMKIDACWVQLLNSGNYKLALAACRGFSSEMESELDSLDPSSSFIRQIAVMGNSISVSDLQQDTTLNLLSFVKAGLNSMVMVPLRTYHFRGVLGVASCKGKRFDKDFADLLAAIGNLICAALDRAHIHQNDLSKSDETAPEVQLQIQDLERIANEATEFKQAARRAIDEAVIYAKKIGKHEQQMSDTLAKMGWELASTLTAKNAVQATRQDLKVGVLSNKRNQNKTIVSKRELSQITDLFEVHDRQMRIFQEVHAC